MWNMYWFPRAYNEKGNNLETLEVFVDHVIYRNESNGYCVLSTNHEEEELIVTGIFQGDVQGAMLRVTGKMEYNANYGEQFKMQQYEIIEPTDAESIRRYLGSGAIKGIGESLAGRIVKRFGDDSLRIIEEEPERLAEVKGISLRKAQEIAEQVEEKKDVRGALMFLQKYGIGNTLAVRIYKTYGMRMYGILQENPYRVSNGRRDRREDWYPDRFRLQNQKWYFVYAVPKYGRRKSVSAERRTYTSDRRAFAHSPGCDRTSYCESDDGQKTGHQGKLHLQYGCLLRGK